MLNKLLQLTKQKNVAICTHWDTDGVTSGALIYHLIKDSAKSITTLSKGKKFIIEPEDIKQDADVIICTDIQPSPQLKKLNKKIAYIDHHPSDQKKFDFVIHDEKAQSTTILIFEKLFNSTTQNPYYLALTLLGYFGDGGDRKNIPPELHILANKLIPELMHKNQSYYSNSDYFYEIERYVSLLNLGKRVFWSGDIPLDLLKSINSFEEVTYNTHPLTQLLFSYKNGLRALYDQQIKIEEINGIHYSLISSESNIQGVLAAKHMDGKPIMVLNMMEDEIIGSLRIPDGLDFDAGEFLNRFNQKIKGFLGGGHIRAGGFTMPKEALQTFLELVKKEKI